MSNLPSKLKCVKAQIHCTIRQYSTNAGRVPPSSNDIRKLCFETRQASSISTLNLKRSYYHQFTRSLSSRTKLECDIEPNNTAHLMRYLSTTDCNFGALDSAKESLDRGRLSKSAAGHFDSGTIVGPTNVDSLTHDILGSESGPYISEDLVDISIQCIKFWSLSKSGNDVDKGLKLFSFLQQKKTNESSIQNAINTNGHLLELVLKNTKKNLRSDVFIEKSSKFLAFCLKIQDDQHSSAQSGFDEGRNDTFEVSRQACNIILDSLAKSRKKDNIQKIEIILEKMQRSPIQSLQPDISSLHSLLYAHSNSQQRGSAKKCEQIFRQIQSSQGKSNIQIGHVTYNIVINAWAKSARRDINAANRAEELLREMQEAYSDGNTRVKPTLVSFTTVIDGWSGSSMRGDVDAALRAEKIFELMLELSHIDRDLKPNKYTWNAMLNAWSKSSLPGAAIKAEGFLQRMYDDGVKPGMISYSICIQAWAQSGEKGSSLRALSLLEDMGAHGIQPDIGVYNSILRALSNDSDNAKASRAETLLNKIKNDRKLFPDTNTYNNVLRCCCTTRSDDISTKRNAIRIAAETMLQLQKDTKIVPDCYTFNFFIKACDRLCSPGNERTKMIHSAFRYSTSTGNFKAPVLSLLKNVLSPAELKKLLCIADGRDLRKLKISDFPPEWQSERPKKL